MRDAVCGPMPGKRQYLWRTINQDDNVRATLVQRRCNKQAAQKGAKKLRKGLPEVPPVRSPDKLDSGAAAKREVRPAGA